MLGDSAIPSFPFRLPADPLVLKAYTERALAKSLKTEFTEFTELMLRRFAASPFRGFVQATLLLRWRALEKDRRGFAWQVCFGLLDAFFCKSRSLQAASFFGPRLHRFQGVT